MSTIEIQTIDPTTLLVDLNTRSDLDLNKEFVASIKEYGVIVPIVAIKTDGGLRVRMGHRRTVAAIEAGHTSVPVVITETKNEGDAAEIERLLTQHAENHHRAGLSVSDDAKVAQQLSLLGVSPAQIAKRTHTKRAHVDTALAVAGSELATKATDRYDLTLDQAAVIAEFEKDTEVVTALIAATETGRFNHVAQRARDDRETAQAQAPIIAALAEGDIPVVDSPYYDSEVTKLAELTTPEGEDITAEDHAECPGHAAYLTKTRTYVDTDGKALPTDQWGNVDFGDDIDGDEADRIFQASAVVMEWATGYVCTDAKANGHKNRHASRNDKPRAEDKTPEEREQDKQHRALVVENNKAWKAAREVRTEWVKTFLTRKTLPTNAGQFLAVALTRDADMVTDVKGNHVAAGWIAKDSETSYGRSTALADAAENANDKRALVVALATVLGGYEARAGDGAWRENGDHSSSGRYLRFLEASGYVLSEVETYAASSETA